MDGLAQKHNGNLTIIRLDFFSSVGRAAAREYGIWLIPAVILFDEQGREINRQLGIIDSGQVSARLSTMGWPAGNVIEK